MTKASFMTILKHWRMTSWARSSIKSHRQVQSVVAFVKLGKLPPSLWEWEQFSTTGLFLEHNSPTCQFGHYSWAVKEYGGQQPPTHFCLFLSQVHFVMLPAMHVFGPVSPFPDGWGRMQLSGINTDLALTTNLSLDTRSSLVPESEPPIFWARLPSLLYKIPVEASNSSGVLGTSGFPRLGGNHSYSTHFYVSGTVVGIGDSAMTKMDQVPASRERKRNGQ